MTKFKMIDKPGKMHAGQFALIICFSLTNFMLLPFWLCFGFVVVTTALLFFIITIIWFNFGLFMRWGKKM